MHPEFPARVLPWGFFGGSPGGGELLLVFIVFLLLFGAKKLPGIARNLGRTLEEFRRSARDLRDELLSADEPRVPLPPPPRPKEPPPHDEEPPAAG